jgi:hypothetical protein
MGKIVVGSSSLTQPLLLYPGLRPAMLDNIDGVRRATSVHFILFFVSYLCFLCSGLKIYQYNFFVSGGNDSSSIRI